jgi:tRNA G18 (ribose-2'-O)-methylase SpoU
MDIGKKIHTNINRCFFIIDHFLQAAIENTKDYSPGCVISISNEYLTYKLSTYIITKELRGQIIKIYQNYGWHVKYENGEFQFKEKRVNVIDKFKHMLQDQIKEEMKKEYGNFSILVENLHGYWNLGTCIRNANIFGVEKVYYYGKKNYDKRSTVGMQHYTDVEYINYERLKELSKEYIFLYIDNIEGAVPIENFLKRAYFKECKYLLIFGEEGEGISKELFNIINGPITIYINQYGCGRSLNVSVANGIVLEKFASAYRNK